MAYIAKNNVLHDLERNMETMQEKYSRIASRLLGADIEQYIVDQMGTSAVDINNPELTLQPSDTSITNPYFIQKKNGPYTTQEFGA